MFSITNLSVSSGDVSIIQALSYSIEPGSLHVLMGPNGSGKSSLAAALLGHPHYTVKGSVSFDNKELLELSVEKRARLGIFLAFQHPYPIPGVRVLAFLHEAYHAFKATTHISLADFKPIALAALEQAGLHEGYLDRYLNDGFSGGEKKRLELAQLIILQPRLAILDEIDSGLDHAGIACVQTALHLLRMRNPAMSMLVITHNSDLAEHLSPTHVAIMQQGEIIASGSSEIIKNIHHYYA